MRLTIRLLLLIFSLSPVCFAQTPMDVQEVKELKRTGSLSTCNYAPVAKENRFFAKLAQDERATASLMKEYDVHGRKGKFVSWFGIVRGISPSSEGAGKFTLLLEEKAFDGLTDCHIMLVSQGGSGDFQASFAGDAQVIPALALVRVYGKVIEEKDKVPQIAAEYIRVWPWGTFTFTDLNGPGDGNPRWAEYCKICKSVRIYNPYPTEAYYLGMLGDPKDFGLNLKTP